MSAISKIEWTEATWNPVTGCDRVSPGCAHCYALTFAERFRGVPGHPYENGFDLQLRPERLAQPLEWKKPKVIFVNSMSDLFHEDIPEDYVRQVFDVMKQANCHTFQVLTKRSQRLAELAPRLDWPDNVWMGVSVENQRWTTRIDDLRTVPAADPLPLLRAAPRPSGPGPARHPLGHRRRRERPSRAACTRSGRARSETNAPHSGSRSSSSSGVCTTPPGATGARRLPEGP